MKLILLYAVAVTLLMLFQGCATNRNLGECPESYKHTQLRTEGKVVLWCVP
jgi:hypothetical protein